MKIISSHEVERGYKRPRKKGEVGNQARWDVYKNDYIMQDHVEAMMELGRDGFSILASVMYAVMARRTQLSIWNSRKFKINKSQSPLFFKDHYINYCEQELAEDFKYSLPSIRRAFKELSDAGYVIRFRSGGSGSKVPSKIIVFQLDRPFLSFKRETWFKKEVKKKDKNCKLVTEFKDCMKVTDYWKQVEEKMGEPLGKSPDDIFYEILSNVVIQKHRRVCSPTVANLDLERRKREMREREIARREIREKLDALLKRRELMGCRL
jgi:DNA-binding transcriptional regulator GbsR (MarR family)